MPIINGIYTKDFPDIGRDLLDTDIIPVAVAGNPITYKTTIEDIRALPPAVTGTSSGSGTLDTTSIGGTHRLIAVYEGDVLVHPEFNKSTLVISGLNTGVSITAYFL